MPKIVDIKIIKGRRAEIVEEDRIRLNILRKCAEGEYAEYKKSSSQNTQSIEEWAQWKSDYKEVYEKPVPEEAKKLLKKAGIPIPKKKPEVSIEQQMLDLIKDGWEPKGELILSSPEFFQTMVLYEGSAMTVTEDLLSLQTTEVPVLNITEVPALQTTPDTPGTLRWSCHDSN